MCFRKILCSFLYVLDACQGPSLRRWSDGDKKRGQQRRNMVLRTIWSKIRLQSSIVHCTEPLFMPDTVWGPDLFGHGLGEKPVVFSKDNLDFRRKITASEFQAKGHYRPVRLHKNYCCEITIIKSFWQHNWEGSWGHRLLGVKFGSVIKYYYCLELRREWR